MENSKGRLLLTLCKEGSTSYQHTIIPFPESYTAAIEEAKQVFPGITGTFGALGLFRSNTNTITLKFGMKRANGSGTWATLRPQDWDRVVRPDDEIGVFVGQALFEMPYELQAGNKVNAAASLVAKPPPPPPATSRRSRPRSAKDREVLLYLVFNEGPRTKNQPKAVISAPSTYEECQSEALYAFAQHLPPAQATDIVLECQHGIDYSTAKPIWVVITPDAYGALLAFPTTKVDMRVSAVYNCNSGSSGSATRSSKEQESGRD
ncbi:hypothetical protein CPB83DRAFT_851678 [Crepidotus variabilis]|uniref:Uncharacterized protein n=1 Tax=Crepidotus variabilis TaxID=179855 RepID=A0A9P6EJ10_9AGAR|nr:hypothetical protein CPB83DRAFT_851678 [Crepidotus variabilis]